MDRLKVLSLVVIMLFLCACGDKTATGYTVIEEHVTENSNIAVITDGYYCYDYDRLTGRKSHQRISVSAEVKPAIYLMSSDDYNLGYIRPITYYGTYSDFCGYINYLYSMGYELVKLDADANYYDIVLGNNEYQIRAIYQNTEEINILCRNSGKNSCQPPYINGKDENIQ